VSRPILDLRAATFTYPGTSHPVFDGLSLQVRPGDRIAVTGPSGAGKSTLLNALGLLDGLTSGELYVEGVPAHAASRRHRADLRAHVIGFVFQAFHLLPGLTAVENVELGARYGVARPRRAKRRAAAEMLDRVGLGAHTGSYPLALSGGEQQRVAIARALIGDRTLLLCDEPTGNLDDESAELVLDTLDSVVASSAAVLVVTHDRRVARRMARRLELGRGKDL